MRNADSQTDSKKNKRIIVSSTMGFGLGMVAFSDVAHAEPSFDDVKDTSVKGLQEYQVFKLPDTELTNGKPFAQHILDSKLGVVIVPESSLQNIDEVSLASEIQAELSDKYDTIIIVSDGDQDAFYVGGSKSAVNSSLQNLLGNNSVNDAGKTLYENREIILNTYVENGGVAGNAAKNVTENLEQKGVIQTSVDGLLYGYNVFQNDGATLSESDTISSKFQSTDIGVVVVPESEVNDNITADSLSKVMLDGVKNNTNDSFFSRYYQYDTVILVVDGEEDTMSVSSTMPEVEKDFDSILGEAPVSDAGWTILENSDELVNSYAETVTKIEKSQELAKQEDFNSFLTTGGLVMGGIIAAVSVVAIGKKIGQKIYEENNSEERRQEKLVKKLYYGSSEDFEKSVLSLYDVKNLHDDKIINQELSLASQISEVLTNLEELFVVLNKDSIPGSQRREIEISYKDRIDKLVKVLGPDYYIAITNSPKYWRKVEERVRRVKQAVVAMNDQVIENIQQLNENSEVDFKVALSSLIIDDVKNVDKIFEKNERDNLSASYNNSVNVDDSSKSKNSKFTHNWRKRIGFGS